MGTLIWLVFNISYSAEQMIPPTDDKVYEEAVKRTELDQYERQKKLIEYRRRAEMEKIKYIKKQEQSNESE